VETRSDRLATPVFPIKKAGLYYTKIISGQFRRFFIGENGKCSTQMHSIKIQKRGEHEIALLPLWPKYHPWMKEKLKR